VVILRITITLDDLEKPHLFSLTHYRYIFI